MPSLGKIVIWLSEKLNWLAGWTLVIMMLLVCTNIVSRLFGRPIMGTVEMIEIMMVVVVAFSLPYGSLTKSHIAVDFVMRKLNQRIQAAIDFITVLVSIGLFGLVAWRCAKLALRLWQMGELSLTLWIPLFPLLYVASFNCILVCVVLILIELPASLSPWRKSWIR